MKLSIVLFGLWLFCIQNVWCQKELSRTYFAEDISNISIDGNGVHSLSVIASDVDAISVAVHLEGETSEEIVITERVEGTTLELGFGSWPLAKVYNDKLSAHKIVSVVVTLVIPKKLFISITSNTAAVFAEGVFESLYVAIEDGNCVVKNFNGNANLTTNSGVILVTVQNKTTNASVVSAYGSVHNELEDTGVFTIYAKSVHGNITLLQTQ